MAVTVFKNPYVSINAVDLSDHVRSATLSYSAELQDKTASGDGTRSMIAGILDWTIEVEFNQDYASGKVDATLFSLVGAAEFAIEVRPDQGAVSTTNPKYTANAVLESYQPMGGSIGDMHVAPATLRPGGTLTRATS